MTNEDYQRWLEENRKRAKAGDEEAKSRLATARTLTLSRLTREYYLKQEER